MTAKFKISAILLGVSMPVFALPEVPDTISTQSLNEVVVNAKMQTTSPQKTSYVPTKLERQAASGGIDLLSRMAIPQISVDNATGKVETNSRKKVVVYIDGEKATDGELSAMRTDDVRRVEYLVYPTDPRFNHEHYVVNFVMAHYEYGGYSKLNAKESFLVGNSSAFVYGKMAYKRMTYDLNVSDRYSSRDHYGSFGSQKFHFSDGDVVRSTTLDDSRYESNNMTASFRAKYMTRKAMISNTVSLLASNVPHRDAEGRIVVTPSENSTAGNTYNSRNRNRTLSAQWSGSYYFRLNSGWSLAMMPTLQYAKNKSHSRYGSGLLSPIVNDADEDSYLGQFIFQLNKQIDSRNTADINGYGVYNSRDIHYIGASPSNEKFRQFAGMLSAGYSLSLDKFYGRFVAAVVGETNKISGQRVSDVLPVIEANAQYSLNDKHSFDASVNYRTNMNDAGLKSPNMLRQNEFLYYEGNPDLKNSRTISADLSYTWLPCNKLSMSAEAGLFRIFDRPVPVFAPDAPNGMMLRRMENNGDYQCVNIGTSLTGRLMNGKLILSLKPQLWLYNTTGVYKETMRRFVYSAQASYYFGRFYATLSYTSDDSSPVQFSTNMTYTKEKDSYQLGIGWRNKHWNVKMTFANMFRTSWVSSTDYLRGRYFESTAHAIGINHRQYIVASVNYTFGFGKKIKRSDEISSAITAGSAILQ